MGIKRIVMCGMVLALLVVGTACSRCSSDQIGRSDTTEGKDGETVRVSENIPDTLEKIPDEYKTPAQAQGHIEHLKYTSYESFSYSEKSKKLDKTAYVYLSSGYDGEKQQYNIFYLMHGGWSNETTLLGTPEKPSEFKNILDHAIADGEYMADMVRDSGHTAKDFFIYAMSGTDDFAYSAFKSQIEAMTAVSDKTFVMADNEQEGNLAFREQEGGVHDGDYANQYTYNGLMWFWNSGYKQDKEISEAEEFTLDSTVGDVIKDSAFGDFGRLLFPVDRTVSEDDTLSEISSEDVYVWYSDIQPEKTVEIVNHLKTRADAATYACVGTRDGIASWNTMKNRLERLENMGISTEFHSYEGLSHGFGLEQELWQRAGSMTQ